MGEKMYTEDEVIYYMNEAVESYRSGFTVGCIEGTVKTALITVTIFGVIYCISKIAKRIHKSHKK